MAAFYAGPFQTFNNEFFLFITFALFQSDNMHLFVAKASTWISTVDAFTTKLLMTNPFWILFFFLFFFFIFVRQHFSALFVYICTKTFLGLCQCILMLNFFVLTTTRMRRLYQLLCTSTGIRVFVVWAKVPSLEVERLWRDGGKGPLTRCFKCWPYRRHHSELNTCLSWWSCTVTWCLRISGH